MELCLVIRFLCNCRMQLRRERGSQLGPRPKWVRWARGSGPFNIHIYSWMPIIFYFWMYIIFYSSDAHNMLLSDAHNILLSDAHNILLSDVPICWLANISTFRSIPLGYLLISQQSDILRYMDFCKY